MYWKLPIRGKGSSVCQRTPQSILKVIKESVCEGGGLKDAMKRRGVLFTFYFCELLHFLSSGHLMYCMFQQLSLNMHSSPAAVIDHWRANLVSSFDMNTAEGHRVHTVLLKWLQTGLKLQMHWVYQSGVYLYSIDTRIFSHNFCYNFQKSCCFDVCLVHRIFFAVKKLFFQHSRWGSSQNTTVIFIHEWWLEYHRILCGLMEFQFFVKCFQTQMNQPINAWSSDTLCDVLKQLYVVTTWSPYLTVVSCSYSVLIACCAGDVSLYLIVRVCALCFHCCYTHVPPPSLQPVGGVY